MTMITPSYLGETIEYSSLHACRSTLEDPTPKQQGDEANPGRQQRGGGELPKQQNQDPSRRGGLRNDQQDDPKNNQR